MASRLIAIASAAALLGGVAACDTISNMFDGKSSSGSSGASRTSSTGSGGATSNNMYGSTSTYGSTGAAGTSYGTSNAPTEMVSVDRVKAAQQALKGQGLYKGPIDGVVGPMTRDAVTRYQRDHNLAQTAMLDDQTLRSLDSRMSSSKY